MINGNGATIAGNNSNFRIAAIVGPVMSGNLDIHNSTIATTQRRARKGTGGLLFRDLRPAGEPEREKRGQRDAGADVGGREVERRRQRMQDCDDDLPPTEPHPRTV